MIQSLVLALLLACGGDAPAPAAETAPALPNPAANVTPAAADALGCKDLDAYAQAVEAFAAEYAKLDPTNPGSAAALSQKSMEMQKRMMELATNPIIYTPACAPRWEQIQARMQKVSGTMEAKAASLDTQQSAMGACMEGCRKGSPEAMQGCIASCMKAP